jgi:hypothetical protein
LKEYGKFDKKEKDDAGKFVQSAKFKKFIHKTINNNMVELDVGYERFLGPEMFFHPVSITLNHNSFRNSSTRIGKSP